MKPLEKTSVKVQSPDGSIDESVKILASTIVESPGNSNNIRVVVGMRSLSKNGWGVFYAVGLDYVEQQECIYLLTVDGGISLDRANAVADRLFEFLQFSINQCADQIRESMI